MLIAKLYNDMISARKGSDAVKKHLIVTLYSEAAMVGKNKRNTSSTDEEVVGVVKKFISNTEETIKLLSEREQDTTNQVHELEILKEYLPAQYSKEQLKEIVLSLIEARTATADAPPATMGSIMAELKAKYAGKYDGKDASEVVRALVK